MAETTYRSPVSKLVKFFRGSRDQWKEKCKGAKRKLKLLKLRLGKLEASRDRWKEKSQQLQAELRREVRHTAGKDQKTGAAR